MGPWEPRPLEAQVVPGGTKIPAGSQECNHSPLTLSPASSSDPKVAPAATDAFSHTRLPVSHCESRPPDHQAPAGSSGHRQFLWTQAASIALCFQQAPTNVKSTPHWCLLAPAALGRSCGSRQLPQIQVLRGPLKTQASYPPGTGQFQQL